jgi:miniconductance mechanosensitive channel
MLVFKDTIEGLAAGIRLTSNNMLHKGDWITVPSTGANGTVEEISLTTVKVRNFDNTIITVSPKTLVEGSFQNWIGMQQSDGRRVKRLVYYDFRSIKVVDSELRQHLIERKYFKEEDFKGVEVNMSLYRRYMEKYIMNRDDVNEDMMVMVRQMEATNAGLPLEFYFFLKNKVWKEYEHHLADIMEHIYAVTADFGLTIYQQYPEQ